MVDVEWKGSAYRIKKCAFDLLSIGGDLIDDDESWDLMGKDLRLKSTFLYCDFNRMISSAPRDQKKSLTELANKLFCSIEEVNICSYLCCVNFIPLPC
jgi:photosystem II oxygen-evolving enhancer protein 3